MKTALQEAKQTLWIVKVQYIDSWKSMPDDPMFQSCRRKRKCFEHEKEIRIIWKSEDAGDSGHAGENGVEIKCKLAKLIEEIVIAPNNHWFIPAIKDVLKKYGINAVVRASDIDSEPT